jgi:tetratricopeptide (TPR) repeat protein
MQKQTSPKGLKYILQVIRLKQRGALLIVAVCVQLSPLFFSPSSEAASSVVDRLSTAQAIAHYSLGFRFDLLGLTNRAVLEYEKAAQFDGTASIIHLRLGAAYARLNMLTEAQHELTIAAEFDPDDVQARYLLALIYSSQKAYGKAAKEYEYILTKLSNDNPQNVEIYGYLAQIYYSQKDFLMSIKQFEKILEIDPENIESMYLLGSLYLEEDNTDQAVIVLKKAMEIDPDHDGVLNTLAYIYAEHDMDLDEAFALITRALEINPENGAYLDSLGWVYYKKGSYDKALEILKKADSLVKDPVIYDHIGDVYLKLNQFTDAMKYWELSLELLPNQEKVIQKINQFKDNQARQN